MLRSLQRLNYDLLLTCDDTCWVSCVLTASLVSTHKNLYCRLHKDKGDKIEIACCTIPLFFFGVVSSITATEDTNSSNTLSSVAIGLSSFSAAKLPLLAAAFISFSLFRAAALFSRCSASRCFCSSETSGSAFLLAGPRNFCRNIYS